jgi:hypothetical protein
MGQEVNGYTNAKRLRFSSIEINSTDGTMSDHQVECLALPVQIFENVHRSFGDRAISESSKRFFVCIQKRNHGTECAYANGRDLSLLAYKACDRAHQPKRPHIGMYFALIRALSCN